MTMTHMITMKLSIITHNWEIMNHYSVYQIMLEVTLMWLVQAQLTMGSLIQMEITKLANQEMDWKVLGDALDAMPKVLNQKKIKLNRKFKECLTILKIKEIRDTMLSTIGKEGMTTTMELVVEDVQFFSIL